MSAYDDLVAADGAVAHLPLTESTGPTSHDLIGGYAGTWYNSPVPGAAGPIAGETALTFRPGPDGPFVLLASAATLPTFPGPFSWEVWFRMPSDAELFTGVVLSTATRTGDTINRSANLEVASTDQPFLGLAFADGVFTHWSDGTGGDDALAYNDTWHHLVYTCAADGATAIYLDGVARINDGAPTGFPALTPTAAVIGGEAQNYVPGSYPYVGASLGALAHVAVYPLALTPCRVLSHFDLATTGHYTPCPEWIRLSHASGRGYWQSQGDVTEEWAGGAKRLSLPFATLAAPPDVLMGKDAVTGLPAFCPPPIQTPLPPVPPIVVPPPVMGVDQTTVTRCGAATAMADLLIQTYADIARVVRWATQAFVGAGAVFLLNIIVDALTGPEASLFLVQADKALATIVAGFVGTIGSDLFLDLGSAAQADILHAAFCSLTAVAGHIDVQGPTLSAWSGAFSAHSGDFVGIQLWGCQQLVSAISLEKWRSTASIGELVPSSACDAMTCP